MCWCSCISKHSILYVELFMEDGNETTNIFDPILIEELFLLMHKIQQKKHWHSLFCGQILWAVNVVLVTFQRVSGIGWHKLLVSYSHLHLYSAWMLQLLQLVRWFCVQNACVYPMSTWQWSRLRSGLMVLCCQGTRGECTWLDGWHISADTPSSISYFLPNQDYYKVACCSQPALLCQQLCSITV